MIKKKILISNNIQNKYLDRNILKRFSKNFTKIIKEVNADINNPRKTLNVLDKKFKFNFKNKDLKKFKNYKTIALIGMGGSILGTEAINNFLEEKVRKKIYFFNDINSKKISIGAKLTPKKGIRIQDQPAPYKIALDTSKVFIILKYSDPESVPL